MLPENFSPTAFCMFGDNKAFVYNDNIKINFRNFCTYFKVFYHKKFLLQAHKTLQIKLTDVKLCVNISLTFSTSVLLYNWL